MYLGSKLKSVIIIVRVNDRKEERRKRKEGRGKKEEERRKRKEGREKGRKT